MIREAQEDTTVNGLLIPKGTWLFGNYWGANYNKKLHDDPFTLKPERYLDSSGKRFSNADRMVSFGVGRRKCPGEQFARDVLFLLTVRFLQDFQVTEHPEHPIKNMELFFRFFLELPEFKVKFVRRN